MSTRIALPERTPIDKAKIGLAKCSVFGIIAPNTPVMPLNDAHSGGFFSSGVFK
jgi:hypothetical protein